MPGYLLILGVLSLGLSSAQGAECVAPAGTALRVVLPAAASLKPAAGAVVEGELGRSVYSGVCEALPSGSKVRAVVERVDKPRVTPVWGWLRWWAGARSAPATLTLGKVEITPPGQPARTVPAQFVRLAVERHLEAGKGMRRGDRQKVLLMTLSEPLRSPGTDTGTKLAADGVIGSGTRVRVDLVTELHTARSRSGDVVQLRVAEPVTAGGAVLVPEGAIFEGVILRARRAARPYRAGRLRLSLQALRLPAGQRYAASVTPTAGAFAGATNMDSEGGLSGGAIDRKRAVLNAGLAYITGKILDDLLEEGAKGAIGVAAAGSAETAGRYVGLAAGAVVFLMHRGREVTLGPHTEMELTFARELRIAPTVR
jgi:hypothetical protein